MYFGRVREWILDRFGILFELGFGREQGGSEAGFWGNLRNFFLKVPFQANFPAILVWQNGQTPLEIWFSRILYPSLQMSICEH